MNETLRWGFHEAGHYIIANLFGLNTEEIKLTVKHPSGHHGFSKIILIRKLNNIQEIMQFIEDRVQILYSGALSETLTDGKVDADAACDILEQVGGENDFAKINEYLALLSNIENISAIDKETVDLHMNEKSNDLWHKTIALVEKNYKVICALGSHLIDNKIIVNDGRDAEYKLSKEEIEELPEIKEWLKSIG